MGQEPCWDRERLQIGMGKGEETDLARGENKNLQEE